MTVHVVLVVVYIQWSLLGLSVEVIAWVLGLGGLVLGLELSELLNNSIWDMEGRGVRRYHVVVTWFT